MVEEEEQGGEDARGQVIICRLTVRNMNEDCMYMRRKEKLFLPDASSRFHSLVWALSAKLPYNHVPKLTCTAFF